LVFLAVVLFPCHVTAQDSTPVSGSSPASESGTTWPQFEQGVVYGETDPAQQVMNVYTLEPREKPRAAVVLIHGGAFVWGSPVEMSGSAAMFTDRGFVTFSIGYRLFDEATGENPFPAALDDVQLAVRWIRANAAEFNVDPDRIAAIGVSTGGQLAGLLGTMETRNTTLPLQEYSSRVTCVVSISGDLDLRVPLDPSWIPLYNEIMGGTLEEHPELYEASSPAFLVDENTVPFMVVHGNADVDSPFQQAQNMVAALAEADIEYVFAEFPGGHHIGVISQPQSWDLALTFVTYQLHPER
jgi:acetyl esterase/lipase